MRFSPPRARHRFRAASAFAIVAIAAICAFGVVGDSPAWAQKRSARGGNGKGANPPVPKAAPTPKVSITYPPEAREHTVEKALKRTGKSDTVLYGELFSTSASTMSGYNNAFLLVDVTQKNFTEVYTNGNIPKGGELWIYTGEMTKVRGVKNKYIFKAKYQSQYVPSSPASASAKGADPKKQPDPKPLSPLMLGGIALVGVAVLAFVAVLMGGDKNKKMRTVGSGPVGVGPAVGGGVNGNVPLQSKTRVIENQFGGGGGSPSVAPSGYAGAPPVGGGGGAGGTMLKQGAGWAGGQTPPAAPPPGQPYFSGGAAPAAAPTGGQGMTRPLTPPQQAPPPPGATRFLGNPNGGMGGQVDTKSILTPWFEVISGGQEERGTKKTLWAANHNHEFEIARADSSRQSNFLGINSDAVMRKGQGQLVYDGAMGCSIINLADPAQGRNPIKVNTYALGVGQRQKLEDEDTVEIGDVVLRYHERA